VTFLGFLTTTVGPVAMKDNGVKDANDIGGNQLMVVDGHDGYVWDVSTATFSIVSGGGWPGNPSNLEYIDGYFIISVAGSMSAFASDLYDGTTWNALATSPVSAAPDVLQTPFNSHQQLFMLKQYTSEMWYDTGTSPDEGFPFQRQSGAVFDYGTPAPFSVARGDNSFFMLANQRNNDGGEFVGVVEFNGSFQIISPPGITYQMSQWKSLSDAFGYCYSDEGHTFYIITSPSSNQTFCYDASTQLWHERSTWTDSPHLIGRHVSNCYVSFAGMHLVGDPNNGNIYQMSSNFYQDNDQPLVSMRVGGHVYDPDTLSPIFIREITVAIETGDSMPSGQPAGVALAFSSDGGHKFSKDYVKSIGSGGQYGQRVTWHEIGSFVDFVPRLTISDPVKRNVTGVWAR
jgi:hypothetical protein